MKYHNDITAEHLRQRLHYDPDNGLFTWRERLLTHPKVSTWNTRFSGQPAGHPDHLGYIRITIDGKCYLAHRLAYLYVTGHWPNDFIDHKNQQPSDNRWCNLRPATPRENSRNHRMRPTNTSGYTGVRAPQDDCPKWEASIEVLGEYITLGYFDTGELASEAHRRAAEKYFGEFASDS